MKKRIFSIISIIAFSLFLSSCTGKDMLKTTPEKTKTTIIPSTIITPNTKVTPDTYYTPDEVITPLPTPDTTPITPNTTPNILPDTLVPTPDGRLFNRL